MKIIRSAFLLAVDRLCHPFAYRLKVQEGDEIVERTVDLVETFNYLLGLHVKKLREFREPPSKPLSGGRESTQILATSRSPSRLASAVTAERLYRAVLGYDRRGKSFVVVSRDTNGLEDNPAALQAHRQFIEQAILPAPPSWVSAMQKQCARHAV